MKTAEENSGAVVGGRKHTEKKEKATVREHAEAQVKYHFPSWDKFYTHTKKNAKTNLSMIERVVRDNEKRGSSREDSMGQAYWDMIFLDFLPEGHPLAKLMATKPGDKAPRDEELARILNVVRQTYKYELLLKKLETKRNCSVRDFWGLMGYACFLNYRTNENQRNVFSKILTFLGEHMPARADVSVALNIMHDTIDDFYVWNFERTFNLGIKGFGFIAAHEEGLS